MNQSEGCPVAETAADWVTRIESGAVDPDDCDELRDWLRQSETHRAVFRRMLDVHGRTAVLTRAESAETVSVAAGRYRPVALAASLLFAAALALWLFAGTAERMETGVGERRQVRLDDGSSLHMNSDSRIRLRLTDDQRLVMLDRGEAVFEVARDGRPFVVESRNLSVTVAGTTFQVTDYGADTTVAVLEGTVSVSAGAAVGEQTVSVDLDDPELRQVTLSRGRLSAPKSFPKSRFAAWRDGWLYLDNAPISELVERLDRHLDAPVRVGDSHSESMRVTLALRLGEREQILADLERLLPVTIEERVDGGVAIHAN